MFDAVLARFVASCPVAVLAHLTMQRALRAEWIDAVFAAEAEQQYTRALLFSTVVDLMGLVALGLRPSLHAAAREALADGTLGVSLQALYEKVNHTEPAVLRALVRASAARLAPVPGGRTLERHAGGALAARLHGCACSTATTCRRARSGSSPCAARGPPRCRAKRWCSTPRSRIWWWTSAPRRTLSPSRFRCTTWRTRCASTTAGSSSRSPQRSGPPTRVNRRRTSPGRCGRSPRVSGWTPSGSTRAGRADRGRKATHLGPTFNATSRVLVEQKKQRGQRAP